MNTLYFECNMGAAGDMLMSALYEICTEKELFLQKMNEAFAPFHVTVSAEASKKCGITGTNMRILIDGKEEGNVHTHDMHASEEHLHHEHSLEEHSHHEHSSEEAGHTGHSHASYASVLAHINALPFPQEVKKHSAAIYELIGNAEAKVHNTTLEQIHFHEVGTIDALVDVTGCSYLLYLIAPEEIISSPIHVGSGFVHCAHGVLPVPAPATAEILKGIPYYTGSVTTELCTPTGAAILKHFVTHFCSMPPLSISQIGYGMGHKDFEAANCVRAFYGERLTLETPESNSEEYGFPYDDSVLSISCNLDDMTGEALGLATEILLSAGALDVYTTAVQMKKNRPGFLLTCICPPEERDRFTGLFFLHTTTRGVRYQLFSRAKLESTFETRHTAYGDVKIKKSTGYGIEKEKAEFEDLKAIVLKHHGSISLDDVRRGKF